MMRTCRLHLGVCATVVIALLCCGAAGLAGEHNSTQQQDSTVSGTGSAAEESAPLYMLTYDHGGLVLWGRDHFVERLRNAITWLDRYPAFKIGLDNEAYTYDELAREAPEVIEEIRGYLERYRGRFGIGTATYGQPLSVFINEESNIRQIEYALEADRHHFGCVPPIYLMSEHAMHSQLPQILTGFGFQGAIMRTHYMMYGYNPTFDVPIGWWEGADGSRIAAIPTYVGEGAQFGRTTKDNWILTRYPSSDCRDSLDDFRREFSRISPLLATRADDAGLRREELVREYQDKPGFHWLLLKDLLPKFPQPKKILPTAPNDYHVRMPWGYCGNEIWDQCRRAEVAVLTAERLSAITALLGAEDQDAALRQAWKDLLVAQHHDIQICGLLDDARRFLPASQTTSNSVEKESLRYAADRMQGGSLGQLTAFNALSWPRRGWIEVPVSLSRGKAQSIRVQQATENVPSSIVSADRYSDGSIRTARVAAYVSIPPLSIVSYALEPATTPFVSSDSQIETDSQNLHVKTPFVEITLEPDGGIRSMKDLQSGTTLLGEQSGSGLLVGRIDGQDCQSKGIWSLAASRDGTNNVTAQQVGFVGSIPYELNMVFAADTPRIDCRCRFAFNGQQIGQLSDNKRDSTSGFIHEHKLRLKLFPNVGEQAVGVRDLPFVIAETPDHYVNGMYWTAVADGKVGMAFFNRGSMGAVRESDGGFSLPLAYAMYYVWGTRMLSGEFTYEFAILPFAGSWQQGDLHRRAVEYNFPLVALATESGSDTLGNVFSPLEISSTNVMLSGLYTQKNHVLARFYEYQGEAGKLQLNCREANHELTEVDLAGREKGSLSTPITFRPWQIRTIQIEKPH